MKKHSTVKFVLKSVVKLCRKLVHETNFFSFQNLHIFYFPQVKPQLSLSKKNFYGNPFDSCLIMKNWNP